MRLDWSKYNSIEDGIIMSHDQCMNYLIKALTPHLPDPQETIESGQVITLHINGTISINGMNYRGACEKDIITESQWVYHRDLSQLFSLNNSDVINEVAQGDYLILVDKKYYQLRFTQPLHTLTPLTDECLRSLGIDQPQKNHAFIQKQSSVPQWLTNDQLLCHILFEKEHYFYAKKDACHLHTYHPTYGHRSITHDEFAAIHKTYQIDKFQENYQGFKQTSQNLFSTKATHLYVSDLGLTAWYKFKHENHPIGVKVEFGNLMIQPSKNSEWHPLSFDDKEPWLESLLKTNMLSGAFTMQKTSTNKPKIINGSLASSAIDTIKRLLALQENPKPFELSQEHQLLSLDGKPLSHSSTLDQLIDIYHDLNPKGPYVEPLMIKYLIALPQGNYIYIPAKKHFVSLIEAPPHDIGQFLMFYRHQDELYLYNLTDMKAYRFQVPDQQSQSAFNQLTQLVEHDQDHQHVYFFDNLSQSFKALATSVFDHHLIKRPTYRFMQAILPNESFNILGTQPLRLVHELNVLDFSDPSTQTDLKMLCQHGEYKQLIERLHGLNAKQPTQTPFNRKNIMSQDNADLALLLPHEYTQYQTTYLQQCKRALYLYTPLPLTVSLGFVLSHYGIIAESTLTLGLLGASALGFLALQYAIFSTTYFYQNHIKTHILPHTCQSPWLFYNGIVMALGIVIYGLTMTQPGLMLNLMTTLLTLAPWATQHHLMQKEHNIIDSLFKNNLNASGLGNGLNHLHK